MMQDSLGTNRAMFWRIVRRLLGANRGRLFVMLLALGAGAAVTAALLNLQVDAKRRLTTEFRTFGANVLILPKHTSFSGSETLPESTIRSVPLNLGSAHVTATSSLYVIATVSSPQSGKSLSTVVVGASPRLVGWVVVRGKGLPPLSPKELPVEPICIVGGRIGRQLQVEQGSQLILSNGDQQETCLAAGLATSGGPEDDQVGADLRATQRLANLPTRINDIELIVPGTPGEIQSYITNLHQRVPEAEVRPIRQFTEGEAKIYNRISGLLTATVGIVLLLTALCVMAAMTNVAMERKMDVGLMKAIGGATRRVLRLFLVEAALLGLAGGLLGAAIGIFLSIGLGKAVFGVAARPRLIVYPVAVALTIFVAILSAFPLRRLASIRPASVFRGEA
ncbi:MAG TPA: ABC transporter permease [Candidatus Acidoferrum sp.]|jgi:putative ABC transport system permease protein|nr:ABC transporter permease [Candidatus Acidoferrum sp.]